MVAAPNKADKTSGGKKKLLLIVMGVLLLILVSVGATLAALKFLSPAAEPAAQATGPVPLAPAHYFSLKPSFTINFNVNGRQRFVQTELVLMYRNAQLEPLLKLHLPAIRNGLVMLISAREFDALQTPEGKEQLRADALASVQAIVAREQQAQASLPEKERATGSVEDVLFTTFLMQ